VSICIQSLIEEAGSDAVKAKTQILVTETGQERLGSFPWEAR
jgi:hypothetical protein